MKTLPQILLVSITLCSFDNPRQGGTILNGIAVDGHRNRLVAINAIIKGTATSSLTDICGQFSIPIDSDEITLLFQAMHYDDTRTFEVRVRRSELTGDTLVFQLGRWKAENPDCKKVDRKVKRHVIE
jgi:hypothetical protein